MRDFVRFMRDVNWSLSITLGETINQALDLVQRAHLLFRNLPSSNLRPIRVLRHLARIGQTIALNNSEKSGQK